MVTGIGLEYSQGGCIKTKEIDLFDLTSRWVLNFKLFNGSWEDKFTSRMLKYVKKIGFVLVIPNIYEKLKRFVLLWFKIWQMKISIKSY